MISTGSSLLGHVTLAHPPKFQTLWPPSYFKSGNHFKVCVTIRAGPAARPNQPHPLALTVSSSVKWKEEESKLFVPWALTGGNSTPVLAKDKSNGICSGEAAYVARCC